jgi:hypothetical protein
MTASASFPANGNAPTSASSSLTISYAAATGNYVVTTANRSQTFRPSDRNTSLSSAEADAYVRSSGATTDSLVLSKNSMATGTVSDPRYRYVGGGVWQRTTTNGGRVSGTAEVFAYGVATGASAVPVSGSAVYPVQLRGVGAHLDTITGVRGTGNLNVDFAKGTIGGDGQFSNYLENGTRVGTRGWRVSASLAGGGNTFSGSFDAGDPNNPVVNNGSITGRFYGPGAQELGASWRWRDPLSSTFIGYMLGKERSGFPSNSGLNDLKVDEIFGGQVVVYRGSRDNQQGTVSGAGTTTTFSTLSWGIRYDEKAQALVIDHFTPLDDLTLDAGKRDAQASNASYDVYKVEKDTLVNGTTRITNRAQVSVFRAAANNPTFQLSYTSFGHWQVVRPETGDRYERLENGIFSFGRDTARADIPTSGTGTYSAIIYGNSDFPKGGRSNPYIITGDASLVFSFANTSFDGSMHPYATNPSTGARYDLGVRTFSGAPGSLRSGSDPFFATNSFAKRYAFSSIFAGRFTGPQAAEFRAEWQTGMTDPVAGGDIPMAGVMVGRRQP